jgi:hypothetical protein
MASIIRATDQNTIRRRGTGLRRSDPTKACPGYTLFAPLTGAGEVYLVDLAGNVVHAWKLPYPPGLHGYLLPNGHLLYGAKTPDVPDPVRPPGWELFKGGAMFEVDWAGNTVWEFHHDDHHDAVRLRNGHTAFLSAERVPADLARRIQGGVPGAEVEGVVFATVVHEITPAGALVWTWRSYEHLDPEADPIPPQIRREFWAMSNTVGELADGSLILSFVNLSLVVIVDRTTGAITWRVGAPVVSGQHGPARAAQRQHLDLRQRGPDGEQRVSALARDRARPCDPGDRLAVYGRSAPQLFQLVHLRGAAPAERQHVDHGGGLRPPL